MMRCQCCDQNLSDYESTRKSHTTRDYLDLCNKCYNEIQSDINNHDIDDRYDLKHEDDLIIDWENDE